MFTKCLQKSLSASPIRVWQAMYSSQSGHLGSGAGKGGGGGGSIRQAGGAFGEREAAQEEMYFRKLQAEQIATLKKHLDEEVIFHESQIKAHEDAIARHKHRMEELHEKKIVE